MNVPVPIGLLPPDYGEDTWLMQGTRLTSLRNLGFQPRAILDVGAYFGHWAGLAAHIWAAAEILSIEANEDCRLELEKRSRPFKIALLDRVEQEVDYHKCQTGCGEGNGLFKENSVFPFVTVKQRTKTLDSLVGDKTFDLIKMDCQGAELNVILGGECVVSRAHLVLLETQLQDYNEGAPRTADLIEQMGKRGFRLYDLVDMHYNSRGMLLQVDLLFARQDSPLFTVRPLS